MCCLRALVTSTIKDITWSTNTNRLLYLADKWSDQYAHQNQENRWASKDEVVFLAVQSAIMRKAFSRALSLTFSAPSCEHANYTAGSAPQRRSQALISYGSFILYARNSRLIQPARTYITSDRKAKRSTSVAEDDDESARE